MCCYPSGRLQVRRCLRPCSLVGAQLYVERYKHGHVLERDRMNEQLSRERDQWGALLPRVIALKDTAGFLVNHLCGWGITPSDEEYERRFHELDTFAEKFAEYPEMRRPIWDLLNTTGEMLRWQGLYTAPGETQRMRRKSVENTVTPDERERVTTVELPERHRALLAACGCAAGNEKSRGKGSSGKHRVVAAILRQTEEVSRYIRHE